MKIEMFYFLTVVKRLKDADGMVNRVYRQSDLNLLCLLRRICPSF